MGLQPLEFSDCYLDSPWFRERIRAHEAELERTNKFIKELIKDGKNLIAATKSLSAAQRKFAHSLRDFKFEFIGDAETDDERCIDASLREFSNFLKNLEEQREIMALSVTETLIKPLEKFRKEQLGAVKEEKKKFDKETEKNYSLIDKHLNLSAKKKDSHLQEADIQVEQNRQHFYELSLEYVCKLQEIQERKKFEFVEPMLSFFQGMFTFYHQGHELAKDFNHYKMELQINIQNTRTRFEGTRSEVEELMNKIRQNPKDQKRASQFTAEGYLYVQEKRPAPFGSSWVKHYCMYRKTAKRLNMIPFEHRSGGKLGDGDVIFLKECTKRHTDSIDRRFCFDIEVADRPGVALTMQAFSEEERKQWLEALGGKEALFQSFNRVIPKQEGSAQLDKMGFTILRKCINAVETRDVKTCNEVDLENSVDWEVKTITSALKQYLRSLPEPLMTYELHGDFIVPAKSGSPESRVNAIHFLVHKLPEKNKEMLDILVKHLTNVSNHSKQNLMTVANLGVVFGPTLMRPQEETVAAIMDLKFQNIVVEILIENHEKIFRTLPDATFPEPTSLSTSPPNAPPRQSKRPGQRNKRPVAVYNLCLDLEDGDGPNPPKEDTPTSSLDSLSSPSPTTATVHGPLGPDRNHLLTDGESFGEWAATAPSQTRSTMVQWLNPQSPTTPSSNPAAPPPSPKSSPFPFSSPATIVDKPPESIANRKARAVYPCEAEHSSELSFEIGAVFEDVQTSREPGWLEGTLNGKRGLIPQNYVKLL
ncbi:rho GTPase-activating protein 10 isoform X2 [Loxodonta africana]|uniref:rho GTPase-activating protein 10 isoform X2 n=1 Tax=Loxodonta africana TaxID=9785 RepID=UPI000C812FBA|nr:rho GTPase-activating protein 10 isoform X2 [Loxodonta africana]XP_049761878.1 rho GTPase-activating protein 10 isoform X2 [Elephas maximus indicus]